MELTLEQQFAEMTGKDTIGDLIKHLSNANGRLPAFALPDTIDAINTLGQLCRTHTNAEDSTIDGAMSLISAALLNAMTDHTITIVNEDGAVADA
jgi:hypothetical protein